MKGWHPPTVHSVTARLAPLHSVVAPAARLLPPSFFDNHSLIIVHSAFLILLWLFGNLLYIFQILLLTYHFLFLTTQFRISNFPSLLLLFPFPLLIYHFLLSQVHNCLSTYRTALSLFHSPFSTARILLLMFHNRLSTVRNHLSMFHIRQSAVNCGLRFQERDYIATRVCLNEDEEHIFLGPCILWDFRNKRLSPNFTSNIRRV